MEIRPIDEGTVVVKIENPRDDGLLMNYFPVSRQETARTYPEEIELSRRQLGALAYEAMVARNKLNLGYARQILEFFENEGQPAVEPTEQISATEAFARISRQFAGADMDHALDVLEQDGTEAFLKEVGILPEEAEQYVAAILAARPHHLGQPESPNSA